MLQPEERSELVLTVQIHILQVHLLKYLDHLVVCLQFQKLPPHMDYSPTENFQLSLQWFPYSSVLHGSAACGMG